MDKRYTNSNNNNGTNDARIAAVFNVIHVLPTNKCEGFFEHWKNNIRDETNKYGAFFNLHNHLPKIKHRERNTAIK